MTVTNRSNDMIWGAYGANAVHMSVLHEYVALSVGLPMGTYYQFSNDLHVYEKHFNIVKGSEGAEFLDPYVDLDFQPLLVRGKETKEQFDSDCQTFLADPFSKMNEYMTAFFSDTIAPMANAWKLHKAGFHASAVEVAKQIEAEDWRAAAESWLARRPPKVRQIGLS